MYPNAYEQNAQNYNKNKVPQDNYHGGNQRDYGHQKNNNMPNYGDDKFRKTKNKIKVTLYKNGFIVNNGQFRDKSIPENSIFMEEVEKGLIPQEIRKKGITDLGILLENRKNELYMKKTKNPITEALNTYIHGNVNNNYNPNQNINNYLKDNPNIDPNIKINPPIVLPPGQDFPINFQEPFIISQSHHYQNQNNYNNPGHNKRPNNNMNNNNNNLALTPIEGRTNRKNIFVEKNENKIEEQNFQHKIRESLSAPKKKEEKKIKTFASLIKEKEEEEKKKKQKRKNQNEEEDENKEEEKKFHAFTGTGQIIGNINTQGLHVNKDIKNIVD